MNSPSTPQAKMCWWVNIVNKISIDRGNRPAKEIN